MEQELALLHLHIRDDDCGGIIVEGLAKNTQTGEAGAAGADGAAGAEGAAGGTTGFTTGV